MANSINKRALYKLEILTLKVLPILIAVIYIISIVLSYFNIDTQLLSILGGTSLFPLIFILISSFCFEFCLYHRIFIYYIFITNIINYYDWYIGIPISNKGLLMIEMVLFGISALLALKLHLNCKRDDESYKKASCKNNK